MFFLLLCVYGPLLLTLAVWIRVLVVRQLGWPSATALTALGVVTANASLAAGIVLYYHFRPTSPQLPPWQDQQILTLALLGLLAPVGIVVGIVAAARGAPNWLILIIEIASVPLLLIGILAGASV
jgi:hypothetical protein